MCFVNLHNHSHYSLLDGFGSPSDIVKRAKELNYPGAALTDHGVTHGLIELYKCGKKEGITPVLGCEVYIARRGLADKEAKVDVRPYHLTVLAQDNEGYENLLKMTTIAHLEGFYYKPRIDYELLKKHSAGLVILSGCFSAHLPRAILSNDEEEQKKVIEWHIDVFGKDRYFLEMQDHPLLESQAVINDGIRKLAKEYDLKTVVTNDSHYPCIEDKDAHDILLCIQTGAIASDPDRMKYTGDFSIRHIEDLRKAFPDDFDALDNSVRIAESCNVDLTFGENLIPAFKTPDGKSADQYLRELCEAGLKARFAGNEVPQDYKKRLDYELKMVHDMGFDTYFLIVWDFIRYAREQNIMVGPGRGSAAGAIIAWTLRITDVDPLAYGLFFERFLNPERVSMPDIDIDFSDHRRGEVLDYVVDKYGRDHVAQIITFGTMAPRAAVRDVGRALGYPYAEVDAISKTVPPPVLGKHVPLETSIVEDRELSKMYNSDERAKTLLDYAKHLEGTVRHTGTHACAVVIAENPLTKYTALQYGAGGKGEIVTQYDAGPLEDLGLLKMDFLGLKNLTIIERTQAIVKRTRGEDVDVDDISLDSDEAFEVFRRGDTTGVFQFESGGMRRYLKELKPNKFDDVVAMSALYRPGPMEWIPNYIKGKHDPKSVKYLHPSFEGILANTYGVAVYQEQILQIARDFAGFSLGEADVLRKAVGKKIPRLLAEQRVKFVKGAVENGHKEKFAQKVFEDVIEPFAGYGFNKAHAVCYGLIAYRTAYLKAHYPIEFMTALLCSDANNMDKVVQEVKECVEMGISVLPPSINESFKDFTVVSEKEIRFGLLAIKGVGEGPIKVLIDERNENGKFKNIEDFAKRVPKKLLNKKLIQALAYSGALDEFGDRNVLAENYEEISRFAKTIQIDATEGQTNIFGIMDEDEHEAYHLELINAPEATRMQRLLWEKEFLGMYVTGHPLRGLKRHIAKKADLISSITRKKVDKKITVVGLISEFKKILTKTGKYMCTFTVEDSTARMRGVLFPRAYQQYGAGLENDTLIVATGRFDDKRGMCQIICDSLKILSIDSMIENAKEAQTFDPEEDIGVDIRLLDDILGEMDAPESDDGIYRIEIPENASSDLMKSLRDLLMKNQGEKTVEIYLQSTKKAIRLPFGVNVNEKLQSSIDKLLV